MWVLDKPLGGTPAVTSQALTILGIRGLKQNTSYYGVRCACGHSLALCEDIFPCNDDDELWTTGPVAVKCECGAVTNTQLLKKFKISPSPRRRSRKSAI